MKVGCKHCKKDFHACGCCDTSIHESLGFCSNACWEGSTEYVNKVDTFNTFLRQLPTKNLKVLESIMEDISTYEYRYDDLLELELKTR